MALVLQLLPAGGERGYLRSRWLTVHALLRSNVGWSLGMNVLLPLRPIHPELACGFAGLLLASKFFH